MRLIPTLSVRNYLPRRWGHTPLWEAESAGHRHVTGFLQHWIVKGDNGETLTAAGGKELLQKIKDIELAAKKDSQQLQSSGSSSRQKSSSTAEAEARLWAKPGDAAAAAAAKQ